MLGMVFAYNPSIWKVESEWTGVGGYPQLYFKFKASLRYLKTFSQADIIYWTCSQIPLILAQLGGRSRWTSLRPALVYKMSSNRATENHTPIEKQTKQNKNCPISSFLKLKTKFFIPSNSFHYPISLYYSIISSKINCQHWQCYS